MIISVKFNNLYSFKSESTLSLNVDGHAPGKFAYQQIGDFRVSKIAMIYGPNASGKTNILKIIDETRDFIVHSFFENPSHTSFLPGIPFLFEDQIQPSCVEINFSPDKKRVFKYVLLFNLKKVISESLFLLEKGKEINVFSRSEGAGEGAEFIFTCDARLVSKASALIEVEKGLPSNISIIALGKRFEDPLLSEIHKYWNLVKIELRSIYDRASIQSKLEQVSRYLFKHPLHRDLVSDYLSKIDLGIKSIEIEEINSDKNPTTLSELAGGGKRESEYRVSFTHLGDGGLTKIPTFFQSAGTLALYIYLHEVVRCLMRGGVLILDEFDANLHPHLVPEIIRLFMHEETNPLGAQLIATCHTVELMNYLDKYQLFFTKKNGDGSSIVYRLSDIDGVRNDENFVKNYNSGAYGAVPESK